ncbi:hypothetical protein DFH11DRAFT_1547548 [Phellopilus nigrolimitatus]|nr:hypothetical protein DFH11DRAFT_1547548 [Phellopilus nigrolimitatus]
MDITAGRATTAWIVGIARVGDPRNFSSLSGFPRRTRYREHTGGCRKSPGSTWTSEKGNKLKNLQSCTYHGLYPTVHVTESSFQTLQFVQILKQKNFFYVYITRIRRIAVYGQYRISTVPILLAKIRTYQYTSLLYFFKKYCGLSRFVRTIEVQHTDDKTRSARIPGKEEGRFLTLHTCRAGKSAPSGKSLLSVKDRTHNGFAFYSLTKLPGSWSMISDCAGQFARAIVTDLQDRVACLGPVFSKFAGVKDEKSLHAGISIRF